MSNATTLQTNNNKLSANNTDLASILNTINNLPEAGSGGKCEIGTLRVSSINKTTIGQVLMSYSGLSFTPSKVIVRFRASSTSINYNSSYGTIIFDSIYNIDGINKNVVIIRTGSSSCNIRGDSNYFSCNIIDNGFEVVSDIDFGRVLGGPNVDYYEYIAIE